MYNLALVDVINNEELSDTTLSNNNDIRRILATVVQALMDYTLRYPSRSIYFTGSDEEGRRIGLYNEAIKKYYYVLIDDFHIEGYVDDLNKEVYNPEKAYQGFLVKRK